MEIIFLVKLLQCILAFKVAMKQSEAILVLILFSHVLFFLSDACQISPHPPVLSNVTTVYLGVGLF